MEKKRAADRHAQRVLREKTKKHIEELEQKVFELTNKSVHESALEKAKKRTLELEAELRELKVIAALRKSENTTIARASGFGKSHLEIPSSSRDLAFKAPDVGMNAL